MNRQYLKWKGWVFTGGASSASSRARWKLMVPWKPARVASATPVIVLLWPVRVLSRESNDRACWPHDPTRNRRMRRPVIAGNWKMHADLCPGQDYPATFLPLIADIPNDRDGAGTAVPRPCRPWPRRPRGQWCRSPARMHWEAQGAYTLKSPQTCCWSWGCVTPSWVTRTAQILRESDEQINRRARCAQAKD